MAKFINLPPDILYSIYAYIAPQDLLALNQTCHALHTLGTTDYIWRQLDTDLPLDIDQPTNPRTLRSFSEIRQSVIDALRIDANWKSKSTQIRNLRRVDHGDIVHRVQLLGEDWLITLSRNPTADTTYLSAWYLEDSFARRAARLEVPDHPTKFHAAVRSDGDSALIALYANTGFESGWIQVYSVSLNHDRLYREIAASPMERVAEVSFTALHEVFTDIQVYDNVIAASLARINETGPSLTLAYRIVLINIDTNAVLLLDMEGEEDKIGPSFKFKLFPECIAFLVSQRNSGSMFFQDIKHLISSLCSSKQGSGSQALIFSDMGDIPIFGCGSLRPLYTSKYFASDYDAIFTQETLPPFQTTLEVLSHNQEKARLFRVPIPPTTPDIYQDLAVSHLTRLEPTMGHTLRAGSHPELLCLGRTGLRMVWIDRIWDVDEYKLMKATCPRTGKQDKFTVSELLPPHVALPFQPHMCVSIWFEEATGRLCFGLHTGEVYILAI